jgi:glycosyltransferase involved in cell wall biosynthesis
MKKNNSIKILHLTDSFNVCCGRSQHIALLVHQLQKQGYNLTVIAGDGDGQQLLSDSGIPVKFYPYLLHRKRSSFNFVRGMFLLAFLQWKYRFDLIHVHCYYQSAMVRFLARWFNIPHLETVHSQYPKGKLPSWSGDTLIAVSNQTRNWILQETPQWEQRVIAIPYGIVTEHVTKIPLPDLRDSLGIALGDFVVGIIGRIVPSKGHAILLHAIAKMSTNIPVVCLVVGEGSEREAIRDLAEQLNVRIIFTGTKTDPAPYYLLSDVVVLPSLAFEGLPITILEAGKLGRAVIVSRINGMKDLIVHEKNGLLVEPGDIELLTQCLQKLYSDKPLREQLGKQLSFDIAEQYSVSLMMQKILAIYSRMLQK